VATNKLALWNLALGKLGVSASGRLTSVTQNHKNRAAVENCYDTLRKSELRRHFWSFAISRRILRAVATTDKIFTPATYSAVVTYDLNDIVLSGGETYISLVGANLANTPSTATEESATAFWAVYRGPLTATLWDSGTQFYRDEIVYNGSALFIALTAMPDIDTTPVDGTDWHEINTATLAATPYRAPTSGRTFAFIKPRDFLRTAPRDPRISNIVLDHLMEGQQIITNDPGPLVLRYVRNVADTTLFDPLFDEALAAKVASETCDEITQSLTRKADLRDEYRTHIFEASTTNAIEAFEAQETDEDTWISVRR